jgi:hypothetical protein
MSITINVAAAKKLPHPTQQYGSIQATVSLQGEAGTLADIPAVMRDLFQVAQAGVDEQLAQQAVGSQQTTPAPATSIPASTRSPSPSSQQLPVQQRPSASQPYRSGNQQRRAPSPVTDSQLRFLKRLIDQSKASVPAILNQFQIGDLSQLSCRDAIGLIDEMKAQVLA